MSDEIKRNTVIELQYLSPGDRFYLSGSVKKDVWELEPQNMSGTHLWIKSLGRRKSVKAGKSVVFLRHANED
jgi:hypothetical protein